MKIIMVDDDHKLCRLVADYLGPMGYEVDAVYNGADGLEKIRQGEYQAAILDVMMPQMDGLDLLKQVRRESDIPVLMLTARGDETDRIVGLEMGADDYLPKTFSSRELLARLRAVTRRYQAAENRSSSEDAEAEVLRFAELEIEQDSRTVRLNTEILTLTPLEYDLLITLAKAAGRVLTRDQLLEAIAGRDYEVFDRSVDVHISSLRRKLGDNPRQPRFIQTVRTAGYMFRVPEKQQPRQT
ncbi:MAG: response regulator transcription factor [Candidatus Electrothrix sp. YB6]